MTTRALTTVVFLLAACSSTRQLSKRTEVSVDSSAAATVVPPPEILPVVAAKPTTVVLKPLPVSSPSPVYAAATLPVDNNEAQAFILKKVDSLATNLQREVKQDSAKLVAQVPKLQKRLASSPKALAASQVAKMAAKPASEAPAPTLKALANQLPPVPAAPPPVKRCYDNSWVFIYLASVISSFLIGFSFFQIVQNNARIPKNLQPTSYQPSRQTH